MNLKDIKAVIFDFDGTLVDSMWIWPQIDKEYLARFGISFDSLYQESIEGMGFTETAEYFQKTFGLPKTVEEIKKDWEEMTIEKYRTKVKPKEHVIAFLEYLQSLGIKLGIATSLGRNILEETLSSLDMHRFFDSIITSCDVNRGKPYPDIYLKVSEHLNVLPMNSLVFEDISAGIKAGKAAGMTVIAVEDDFSLHKEAEKKALADYYIKDFKEVFDFIWE